MDYTHREQEILRIALDKFQKTTGLPTEVQSNVHPPVLGPDAVVRIRNKDFAAKVKVNLRRVHVAAAMHELVNYPMKGLIITRYVTPQIANYLKELNIAFIDTAGNAYINEPPVFVYVRGNRPTDDLAQEPRHRAFQPAGLKLLFALLCNPGLERNPYREITKKAGVALGTVNWILKDLVKMGYILDMGKQGRSLLMKKDLLKRWVTTYPEMLRPRQLRGRYKAKDRDWWKNTVFLTNTDFDTYWGGEIAVAKLTGYLKPMIVTIYTEERLDKFTLRNRLKKDPAGDVEILIPFWTFEHRYQNRQIVPPLLVYADLLATGDPRNIEAAKVIYDQELIGLIEED